MIKDIFITKLGQLLAGWHVLSPNAECYSSMEILPTILPRGPIFWLHVDAYQHDWMRESIDALKKRDGAAKIIILANVPDQQEAMLAFDHGALGYTHAYHDPIVLAQVRQVVEFGGVWLGQEILRQLIQVGRKLSERSADNIEQTLRLLTPREREVAIKAAQGLNNKSIAKELGITERTVKAHLTAVFERIGVKDRLQLAIRINERLSS
jgi:two-component system, NarL family, nitrate/nitrite response regulator NarL